MVAESAGIDGKSRSRLGSVASVFVTWFVFSFIGAFAGLLFGVAIAGLEGGYVGATIGVAIASASCFVDESLLFCVVGGLLVGIAAALAGLSLGLPAGVWGGALAGIGPGLLGRRQLESGRSSIFRWVLRAFAWVAVGAAAGAAGLSVLDGFKSMEL
jgi:hypothetical protein